MIVTDPARVADWVFRHMGSLSAHDGQCVGAVGWERRGELTAGLVLDDFNGSNIWGHVAIVSPSVEFAIACMRLVFGELGATRLTMQVRDDNARSIALMRSLGAVVEHVMPKGHSSGNTLLFVLWRGTGLHQRLLDSGRL